MLIVAVHNPSGQESAEAAALPPGAENGMSKSDSTGIPSSATGDSTSSGEQPGASQNRGSTDVAAEVARFGAAKERKHSLEAGIALFNRWVLSC